MNAKEFAHELEKAASFIRQQQAEIEALKAGKIRAYDNGVEDGRKPDTNSKPVAWMLADKKAEHIRSIMAVQHDFVPERCVEIPLYTHPVKDLEDIDINITWNENSMRDFGKDELAFARAILRKAQENDN